MKNFFKLVLANIVAIALMLTGIVVFFFLFIAASAINGKKEVTVKSNSILTLDFKTKIIDSPAEGKENIFNFNDDQNNVTLYNIIQSVKKAKNDDKIKGISIETDNINAGITQLEDVRNALLEFKKSGKFVYAYGNTVSQPAYYLGSVADKYYLNPAGGVELKGMAAEVVFFKDFMDKYGINAEVIRHGKFKAAVEPFLKNEISPENKEQLSTLLNDIWGRTSSEIAKSRNISPESFKTTVDSLYSLMPDLSLKNKLVDQLIQESQYEAILKAKLNIKKDEKLNKISFANYVESNKQDDSDKDNQIAVLYASGEIYGGKGYDGIYAENFKKQIKKLADDKDVKAVVLRVNSPGGSANAADEILFELQQLKNKKPLVVSFGDYAASGGYYIAMAANKIYCEPNSITGSIGVFGIIPYFKDIANKNGIRSDVVSTNANSLMVSPINGLTPGTVSIMTRNVEGTYKRFVYFVTQNRKKSFEQIDALGGGRVWSGTRAKEIGLVDELGTLDDAILYAAGLAKVKSYDISSYPKKMNKFEQLFKGMNEDEISTKIIENEIGKDNYQTFEQIFNPKYKEGIMMKTMFNVKF
ncbi:signal peptide peptidase SppA [Halpernia frigidisoli]|uniref:Protease-4 n=1 Tax=Halpernia frigidisoli TaxID=1125876 RepID=A0A1I3FTA8_9FLAO|nr:signal peptide peptidase SppA [Halpernia frigidisoli]SFI14470.1 protease-4 [Halpernia frigidisoli]